MPSSSRMIGGRDAVGGSGHDPGPSDPTAGSGVPGVCPTSSRSAEPSGSEGSLGPPPGSVAPEPGSWEPGPGRAAPVSAEPSRRGVTEMPCAPWGLVQTHPCDGEAPVVPDPFSSMVVLPVPRWAVPRWAVSSWAVSSLPGPTPAVVGSAEPRSPGPSGASTQRPSSLSRLQRTHRPWPLSKLVGPPRW